jgi:hypothetical protein
MPGPEYVAKFGVRRFTAAFFKPASDGIVTFFERELVANLVNAQWHCSETTVSWECVRSKTIAAVKRRTPN